MSRDRDDAELIALRTENEHLRARLDEMTRIGEIEAELRALRYAVDNWRTENTSFALDVKDEEAAIRWLHNEGCERVHRETLHAHVDVRPEDVVNDGAVAFEMEFQTTSHNATVATQWGPRVGLPLPGDCRAVVFGCGLHIEAPSSSTVTTKNAIREQLQRSMVEMQVGPSRAFNLNGYQCLVSALDRGPYRLPQPRSLTPSHGRFRMFLRHSSTMWPHGFRIVLDLPSEVGFLR